MRIFKVSRLQYAVTALCLLALLTGCSGNPNEKKQKYLESGQRYFDKGQFREAQIQFKNAVQVDPRFAEAHYKLAQTAMKLGDGLAWRQQLETTIQLQPENFTARLELANLLILAHDFEEVSGHGEEAKGELAGAKEQLDWLAKNQPNNPEVSLAQAGYDLGSKNMTAALADALKAVRQDPNRSDSFLLLARLYAQGQQWDLAETNFRKAIDLNPKSTIALVSLGNLYQTRGRFPEAEQYFRRAIDTAPDAAEPRRSLGNLYLAENKPGQTEEFLRQSKKDFPDNPAIYRMLGNYYHDSGQLDKAVDELAALYRAHPKDMVLKRDYIQLLILTKRIDDARKLNDEILKATPDDEDAQIYKAEIEIEQGKPGDAVNILQAVLKNDPDNGIAHYQLGLAFGQLGNTTRAEAELRDAVRLRPDNVEAHRGLAHAAIARRDASGLAQEAEQIIALQPAAPDGYLFRSGVEIGRKQFAEADKDIKLAMERQPNNFDAYMQLGNLRMAQNQPGEAQKAYREALDLNPNSTDALFEVLAMDVVQKQVDRAVATAKTQLAKYPDNVGFHIVLGQLLLDQKHDLPGAEAEFKRASDLDPKNGDATVRLGTIQSARGATDQALQTYLDAQKANPGDVALYLLAGQIYRGKQDWEHARQQYQKALDLQPDSAVANNEMAYIMLEQGGNIDVAFAMAQTARRQLPDSPGTADTLGWAFYHKKVYASAITLFTEAVKKDPDNAVYNYHLGLAYAKNGQAALAKEQLDHLVKTKPNFPDLDELRRALSEIKG
jgi:tetratricopeptide (TPR) repeat protein